MFLIITFNSCSLGFEKNIKVIGNYYLTAPDDDVQLSLTYCDPKDTLGGCFGIVTPTVFSVGYNKDYIIAKQHPNDLRTTTNYFIVPLNPKERVWGHYFGEIGPLTLNEFNAKITELNIKSIKFSITEKTLQ